MKGKGRHTDMKMTCYSQVRKVQLIVIQQLVLATAGNNDSILGKRQ